MRYRLRTLLIVLALGPPVLAGSFAMRDWFNAYFSAPPKGAVRVITVPPRATRIQVPAVSELPSVKPNDEPLARWWPEGYVDKSGAAGIDPSGTLIDP